MRPPPLGLGAFDAAGADAAVAALRPHLSAARLERIEQAIASRLASVTLVLDRFHDPHNAGAALRSADAFGLLAVHAIESVEPFVVARKAAQGAHKWIDVRRWQRADDALTALASDGFAIWVADAAAAATALDLPRAGKVALVFGNEHDGVAPAIAARSNGAFAIPMRGFVESFNVSVAVALALAAVTKDRAGDLDDDTRARLRAAWLRRSVREADAILERKGLGPR
jgi:tRNA (guanosine-2'-O-)-methyltransferase